MKVSLTKRRVRLSYLKIPQVGMIMLLLLIVGCAIPLQQSPELMPQQSQAEPAEKQSRSLALEDNNIDATSATVVSDGDASDADSVMDEDVALAEEELPATFALEPSSESDSDAGTTDTTMAAAQAIEESLAAPSIERLDLTALEQTFLETINAARDEVDQINEQRFVEVTDERDLLWQGEALVGESQTIVLMQPIQSGGQVAVRLLFASAIDVDSPEVQTLLAQILATIEIALSEPESLGPPNAEIQFVQARETSPGVWSFNVRLNHPDTGWEDYTDGWHVETLDGRILGVRILLHPHVNEMPFSRSQGGIAIPADMLEVQVRSHDLVSGYGQETVVVPISESDSGERYEVIKGPN